MSDDLLLKQDWGSVMTPKARVGLLVGTIIGASLVGGMWLGLKFRSGWITLPFAGPAVVITWLLLHARSKSKKELEANKRIRETAYQRLVRKSKDVVARANDCVYASLVDVVYEVEKKLFTAKIEIRSCSPNGHNLNPPVARDSISFMLSILQGAGVDFELELEDQKVPIVLPPAGNCIMLVLKGRNHDNTAIATERMIVPCAVSLETREFKRVTASGQMYCKTSH